MLFLRGLCAELPRWLLDLLILDVPEEMAVCEFDCRKLECSKPDRVACNRRFHSETSLPIKIESSYCWIQQAPDSAIHPMLPR